MKRIVALIVVAAMLIGIVGCGSDSASSSPAGDSNTSPSTGSDNSGSDSSSAADTPEPSEDAQYKDKITVRLAGEILNLNPVHLTGLSTYYVGTQIYASLIKYDLAGNVVPWLAEKWDISDDGMIWTIKIKENAKFSNGADVTAEAVKFNYDLAMDEATGSIKRGNLVKMIDSITALDTKTLEFKLTEPAYLFPDFCLNMYLAEPESLKEYGDNYNGHAVGAGMYKLKEYVPGERYLLEANEDYFDGAPATKYVEFKIIPDSTTAQIELEEGTIDILQSVQQADLDKYENSDKIKLLTEDPLSEAYFVFNFNVKPFDDINVRKGIAHAIDRDGIASSVIGPLGIRADGFMPPIISTYYIDDPNGPLTYDLDKAKEYFKEAGYEDTDGDGILDKNGEKLTVEIAGSNAPPRSQVSEIIQNNLKKAGIESTLNLTEQGAFVTKLQDGTSAQTYVLDITQDYYDPMGFIDLCFATGSWSYSNYKNDRVIEICELTKRESDTEIRKELFKEAQEILYDEMPAVPLYARYTMCGVNANMEDFVYSATGWLDLHTAKVRIK